MRRVFLILWLYFPGCALGAAVDHERIVAADAATDDWLTHGRNYAETRESPLRQITVDNVRRLGLAWYFDTGTKRGPGRPVSGRNCQTTDLEGIRVLRHRRADRGRFLASVHTVLVHEETVLDGRHQGQP